MRQPPAQGRRAKSSRPSPPEEGMAAKMLAAAYASDSDDEESDGAAADDATTNEDETAATDTGDKGVKTPKPTEDARPSEEPAEDADIAALRASQDAALEAYENAQKKLEQTEKDYGKLQSFSDREMNKMREQLQEATAQLNNALSVNQEWVAYYQTRQQQEAQQAQAQQQQAAITAQDEGDDDGYADPVARRRAADLERKIADMEQRHRSELAQVLGHLTETQKKQQLAEQQREQASQIEAYVQTKVASWRKSVKDERVLAMAESLLRNRNMDEAEERIRAQAVLESVEKFRTRREAADNAGDFADDDAGSGSPRTPKPRTQRKVQEPIDFSKLDVHTAKELRVQMMADELWNNPGKK